jgi:hypothetical protein
MKFGAHITIGSPARGTETHTFSDVVQFFGLNLLPAWKRSEAARPALSDPEQN